MSVALSHSGGSSETRIPVRTEAMTGILRILWLEGLVGVMPWAGQSRAGW